MTLIAFCRSCGLSYILTPAEITSRRHHWVCANRNGKWSCNTANYAVLIDGEWEVRSSW